MSARPPILVLGGVTAAGKTDAALALARRLGGELIGADSVQVYRGFDIGSAKPNEEELSGIPHHLLDVADPDEPFDAARFAAEADRAIAGVSERGKVPIVVGGTGLWLRALLRGLVELPPADPELRARLTQTLEEVGAPAMHARLAEVDPLGASKIHVNDALRILRGLEVHAQTGEALGELRAAHALGAPRYRALFYALDRPREELYEGIKARLRGMIEEGWVEEVRGLIGRWGPSVRPLMSVGYRQIRDHLVEGVPEEEALRLAYKTTRIYTRRQRTWLRGEPGERIFTDAATVLGPEEGRRIDAFLSSSEGE